MPAVEKLDIFLITYNRAPYLKRTLEQIFSAESPVKDFPITIIDNNSTDGTADVIKNFQADFPNIIYKKNKIFSKSIILLLDHKVFLLTLKIRY